jgi:hypothetical protein
MYEEAVAGTTVNERPREVGRAVATSLDAHDDIETNAVCGLSTADDLIATGLQPEAERGGVGAPHDRHRANVDSKLKLFWVAHRVLAIATAPSSVSFRCRRRP